ncbi:nucleolar protein of 40 kDa-like isoform X2 [Thrips palmi]|uniref:Nucleolar protein of 40 kDa-like isoform X2 n=1 Tax=Thrips palmi TaxID=161013 RepID=A0A6P8YFJ3_THRPL|nr:nucleolar protein of 40 kDa-like isoform X2 [Thrips palmi]
MSDTTRINTIFLGEVASVQNYGAFVKIPGTSNQGLVHRSQISKVNVPDVSEVLAKGDRVWCKIVNTTDDGKIGLSMKVVDQGNGKDLDPAGVQMKLDEQRRKEWTPGEKRKTISLEAVFNTTCSKCGTRGHLSKDCFQVAGGKTYELLPEDALPPSTIPSPNNKDTLDSLEKIRKKKEKKEARKERKEAKKRKKAAKKLKKKLKKKAKKVKKLKKKESKHSSSDDSSDTSDSSSSSTESESDDERHKKEKLNTSKSKTVESHERSRSSSHARISKRSRSNSGYSQERADLEDRRKRRNY